MVETDTLATMGASTARIQVDTVTSFQAGPVVAEEVHHPKGRARLCDLNVELGASKYIDLPILRWRPAAARQTASQRSLASKR